jgi:hypothetical protein
VSASDFETVRQELMLHCESSHPALAALARIEADYKRLKTSIVGEIWDEEGPNQLEALRAAIQAALAELPDADVPRGAIFSSLRAALEVPKCAEVRRLTQVAEDHCCDCRGPCEG